MKNYIEALNVLNGRDSRKIDNNTYLKKRDNGIAVMLHETDIITFLPDNTIIFNSGGWRTNTTKERMNSYSPCQINQKNYVWYINGKVYNDGIKFKNGKIIGSLPNSDKKTVLLKKKIKNFVGEYIEKFMDLKIEKPSGGDCWHCSMTTQENKPLGEALKDSTHILEHIKEGYFVPSLIVNAEKVFPVSPIAKNFFYETWGKDIPQKVSDRLDGKKEILFYDVIKSQFSSSLKRYIYRQVNLAS